METGKLPYMMRKKYRVSWRVIAERLGFSHPGSARTSALGFAKKNNLKWPIKAIFRNEIVYHMIIEEGMNRAQIAEELNIKKNSVDKLIKRYSAKV